MRFDIWQRIEAGKDDSTVRRALIVAGFLLTIFMVLYTTMGLVARVEFPNVSPEASVFYFVDAKLHLTGSIVFLVALLSAVMSSADSILNALALNIVKLLPQGRADGAWSEGMNEVNRKTLAQLRITTIVVGTITVLVAFILPDIVDLNVAGLSTLLVFLPVMLFGLFARRVNRRAGFWSVVMGLVGVLAMLPVSAKMAFLPGLLLSVVTYFIVRYLKPN